MFEKSRRLNGFAVPQTRDIDEALQQIYQDILEEPIPESFLELLARLPKDDK